MKNYYQSILTKYRSKNLLIDTNILLLLIVGTINVNRISKFTRTENFKIKDYKLLLLLAENFKNLSTTPNILTEVNSFINQLREPEHSQGMIVLSKFIQNKLIEIYLPSQEISKINVFSKYGLTDCGIINLANTKEHLVLTVDFPLANYLASQNIDVINFNNLRLQNWYK